MNQKTRNLTAMGMLCAIAYVVMLVTRPLPNIFLFLQYDPKDVILAIGGFLFGPIASLGMAVLVCLLEMVTVSKTGPYGLIMNLVSSAAFLLPAAAIYKRKRKLSGAIIGLVAGTLSMTIVMIIWNYFVVPRYMGVSTEEVAGMLIPIFLPFNLLKGTLNAAITMLLYKPVVSALRKSRLLPVPQDEHGKFRFNIGVMLVAAIIVITLAMLVLMLMGIL